MKKQNKPCLLTGHKHLNFFPFSFQSPPVGALNRSANVINPPNANELVGTPPLSLDAEWALKNFLGKTQDEVREMCRANSSVTEDFTYMTALGLSYYLPAALSYL